MSNSVGRANFDARARAEGLECCGWRPAGVRMEFEAGEGKKFVGEEVILARVEERGVHRGGVFVRCDLGGRLGMWEAAGNDGEIGEVELRE